MKEYAILLMVGKNTFDAREYLPQERRTYRKSGQWCYNIK